MYLYRITRSKYAQDLSGTGARNFGGRWNNRGVPMLYTATYKSLAVLETLVNIDKETVPLDLMLITLNVPEKAINNLGKKVSSTLLNDTHGLVHFQRTGTEWARSHNSLGLRVPTVLVPHEWNIILNPLHSEFSQVKIDHIQKFGFDKRFFK